MFFTNDPLHRRTTPSGSTHQAVRWNAPITARWGPIEGADFPCSYNIAQIRMTSAESGPRRMASRQAAMAA